MSPGWYALDAVKRDTLQQWGAIVNSGYLNSSSRMCVGLLLVGLLSLAWRKRQRSILDDSQDAYYETRAQELLAALTSRPDCIDLFELTDLRRQGWNAKELDKHFDSEYVSKERGRFHNDIIWARLVLRDNLRHIDKIGRFVYAKRFLDIGCCPGGYSTYVLQKCSDAFGLGISLPVSHGGPELSIPRDLLERIEVIMADITQFDLAPSLKQPEDAPLPVVDPIPFTQHTFDLVVCDGYHVDSNPNNRHRTWNWTRMLISQLLLGLLAVSTGGTIFFRLSRIEKPVASRVLLALCRVAKQVSAIKSTKHSAHRGVFYVIARDVCVDSDEFNTLVIALEKLWYTMSFGGLAGHGRKITWDEMDTITRWEELISPEGQDRLVRLGVPVWQIQRDALRDFLHRQDISAPSS